MAPGAAARPRTGLAVRTAVLTTAVAGLAVLLAGVASVPLIARSADRQARRELGALAAALGARATLVTLPARRELLVRNGIDVAVVLVRRDGATVGADAALLPGPVVQAAAAGRRVDTVVTGPGGDRYVEGRPPAAGRAELLLLQSTAARRSFVGAVLRRLALALVAGLVVAAGAGAALARRLNRPLADLARAARRLAVGHRDVTVPRSGPAEVADVAAAIAELTVALAAAEGAQQRFLVAVSHELRTPLTGITGYAEALADGVVTGAEVPATAAVVLAEARRLERLVADLLALARLDTPEFSLQLTAVDLAAVLRAAARSWSGRADAAALTVHLELPDGPVWAYADGDRCRQVIDVLIDNAVRLCPPGAPVVLACQPGTAAAVEVRDGGPGLTDEDLAVAFVAGALHDRYRGSRRGGSGVGLALAAGLVQRMGGRISVAHAAEGGACFRVELPTAGAALPAAPTGSDAADTVGR